MCTEQGLQLEPQMSLSLCCYVSLLCFLFAGQVFYHLGELDEALNYALGAGSLFDVNDTSDYVQTLVGECRICHCVLHCLGCSNGVAGSHDRASALLGMLN